MNTLVKHILVCKMSEMWVLQWFSYLWPICIQSTCTSLPLQSTNRTRHIDNCDLKSPIGECEWVYVYSCNLKKASEKNAQWWFWGVDLAWYHKWSVRWLIFYLRHFLCDSLVMLLSLCRSTSELLSWKVLALILSILMLQILLYASR